MIKNPSSLKNEANKYKTDRFTLHQEKPGRWKVSGRDSSGKYRRIRFDAKDLNEAMTLANDVLEEQATQATGVQQSNAFEPLQISDALIRSCENQNWTSYTRKQELANCDYFLRWVDDEGLAYWRELRYEHIVKYKHHLESRNLAYDTIRLYLLPVRRAARWIAANWPKEHVNICQNLRLTRKNSHSSTYNENEGNPYLPIHQVMDFLDYLSRDPSLDQLLMGAALQGLMGFQLLEALRLTWGKVDFSEETITIDGTVKNRYRIRKIPMISVVSWILRQSFQNQPLSDLIITKYAAYDNYSHAITRELKRWNSDATIKPKDLRNTIQTAAIDGGWYGYYVQRYVGHAPTTIGERHYHGDQGKRMLPLFRDKVVKPIEDEIKKWIVPVDSVIFPGPRLVVNQ